MLNHAVDLVAGHTDIEGLRQLWDGGQGLTRFHTDLQVFKDIRHRLIQYEHRGLFPVKGRDQTCRTYWFSFLHVNPAKSCKSCPRCRHVSGRLTHHLLKNLGCFCDVNHHLVEDVEELLFCSEKFQLTSPSCTHPTNYPELPGRHHISLHEVGHPERANQAVIIARTKDLPSRDKNTGSPSRTQSLTSSREGENPLRKRDLKIDASERSEDISQVLWKSAWKSLFRQD